VNLNRGWLAGQMGDEISLTKMDAEIGSTEGVESMVSEQLGIIMNQV